MNRMTVLIALLGLALFVGCNQTDGSGSEWICAEGRVGNSNEQDWQCYSQIGWEDCHFKYVCEDATEEEWFCSRLGSGRKYDETCTDQYICQDLQGHNWACDSEATQAFCENNYFANPSDFFLCNSAARNRDPKVYWACPEKRQNIPGPPNFRQIKVQTVEPNPNPPPDFSVFTTTVDAPCNLDPVAEGCTFLGGEECAPLWSNDGRNLIDPATGLLPEGDEGTPKNYCNAVACTRL